jgi:hypothetical protein
MEIYLWSKVLFSGYYYYLRNIIWGGGEKNYNEKSMWQIILIIGLLPTNN